MLVVAYWSVRVLRQFGTAPHDPLVRLDVLIEAQDVPGVILFLNLHQAGIVRPTRHPDQLVAGLAELVDVGPMGAKGCN
jgi:hypothetical protein